MGEIMSRMKSHWPEQINPLLELRSARRWLESGLKQDRGGSLLKPDVYRMMAIIEAIAIIDKRLEEMERDSELRIKAHTSWGVGNLATSELQGNEMSYEPIQIDGHLCTCEVCGFEWIHTLDRGPKTCRNRKCRSRSWNGVKKNGHPFGGRDTSIETLPKPTKVRNI